MTIELKPCPFCAGEDIEFVEINKEGEPEDWGIICNKCGMIFHSAVREGEVATKKEVAGFWNNRWLRYKDIPNPCTEVEGKTVKDWFQKINEELDELKEKVFRSCSIGTATKDLPDFLSKELEKYPIAEEAADTITAITSMLEAMGIDSEMRQSAQRRVNEKNKERGRF